MTETVKPVTQIVIDNDEQMYELNGDVMREIITLHHTDYSYYLFDRMTAFEIHFDREVYVRVYRYGYVAEQAKDEYIDADWFKFDVKPNWSEECCAIGCRKFYDGDESKNRSILLEWLKGNLLLKEVIEKQQAIIDEYLAARQKEFSPSEVLGDQSV